MSAILDDLPEEVRNNIINDLNRIIETVTP